MSSRASNPPWPIHILTQPEEMDMVASFLIAHSDDSRHLFFPNLNNDSAAAAREASNRLWTEHTADPHSTWIMVLNPNTPPTTTTTTTTTTNDHPPTTAPDPGPFLGVCQWRLYPTNPFPFPPGNAPTHLHDAPWWPPQHASSRAFTSEYTRQILGPRSKWMSRAHTGMSWIAVHPGHRRRGIGTALMEWGIERTDEMGVESYIEGTVLGARLYAACGYVCVKRVGFEMGRGDEGDEEWMELQRRLDKGLLPPSFAAMWRPVGGKLGDGEPERTWSVRLAS